MLGDPALESLALRYSNGSVQLATMGQDGGFHIASSEWLAGPITAMSNGASHLCLLLESGFVECRATASPVAGFNASSGVLMQHRSGVHFTQLAAANCFTCALRVVDSRVECTGTVAPSEGVDATQTMSMSSSTLQYSVIAAEYFGGWCGLTLGSRDLYCWSVRMPVEVLSLPAPTAPLSWRAPFFSGPQTHGCAILTDGHFACNWTDGSLGPNAALKNVLSDVTAWNGRLFGALADTGQVVEYTGGDINIHPYDYEFLPVQLIGVDASQGNDSTCTRASTLSAAELRSFIPCQSLAGALRIAQRNTWIQLLPGTHLAGDLVVGLVDVTLSSQPPPFLSDSEIALIGAGAWSGRMAAASALSSASIIDCTGFDHCLSSSYVRLSLIGLTFTGSAKHAIVHTYSVLGAAPVEPELILLNSTFTRIGGALKKENGQVLIRGCIVTESTQNANVSALVDLSEANVQLQLTRFERHTFLDALDSDPALRSCVRASGTSGQVIEVIGCSWNDCHAAAPYSTSSVMAQGGVALQIVVSGALVSIKNCTFTNQSTTATTVRITQWDD